MNNYYYIKIPKIFKMIKISPALREDTWKLTKRLISHKKKFLLVSFIGIGYWNRCRINDYIKIKK